MFFISNRNKREFQQSSNVPLTEYPFINVGFPYALGARVFVPSTGSDYESVIANNTTSPLTSPENWVRVGASLLNRLLDDELTLKTCITDNAALQQFTFNNGQEVYNAGASFVDGESGGMVMTQLFFDFENNYITTADTLAILGMDNVGTLKIKIHDAIDDRTEVLEIDLRDESKVTDWFWYFYSPITKKKEIVISFSPISNRRTLTRTSNIEFLFLPESGKNSSNYLQTKPAVSEIVVGTKYTLGKTMYGMNLSIQDFSRVERDDFGNAFVNKRSFAKRMSVPVRIDTATTDSVFFTMSDVRATPVVWVADMGFRASIIFGFYTEFSIALQDFNDTLVNLEVLGLPE